MDWRLIENINSVVGQRDMLYILGDFTGPHMKREQAVAYRHRIMRKYIHLIHGHSHNGPEYNQRSIEQGLLHFDVGVVANSFIPVSEGAVMELVRQAET